MTVRIYTANFGGRDVAHRQAEQDIPIDQWVHFTDQVDPAPAPWTTVRVVPNPEQHPNMAAKWFKTHPAEAFGPPGAPSMPPNPDRHRGFIDGDYAIWIDSSMQVTSRVFAREAIASLDDRPLAAFSHPRRDCIYDEADASLGAEGQNGRYALLPIREQVEHYRAEGYPEHNGLYACGSIVWTPAAVPIGEAWYDECLRWGYQDQLSFPVVCRRAGVRPAVFPVPQIQRRARDGLANRWLTIHNHRPGTD